MQKLTCLVNLGPIPGPTTPTKGYAGKQLDAFEQVLNRLEKGIPTVPLRNQGGKSGNTTPNQAGTGLPTYDINGKRVN
jgi:hypothetical protein